MFERTAETRWPVSSDRINLVLLLFIVLGIYYPVLHAQYVYTDEATQLWFSDGGTNGTYIAQGRYLTYLLFKLTFRFVTSINDIRYMRIFSFISWIIFLPVWYYTLKRLITENKLPVAMLMLSMLYMVCMPPFTIYVCWASCLEMSFACTAGLLSGYYYYCVLTNENITRLHFIFFVGISIALGLVALFTYQNGFGCFFIPFFIRLIACKKITREIITATCYSLLIFVLYYLLFKLNLRITGILAAERSSISTNPAGKLFFLFTRPLAASFHFTRLFSDISLPGIIIYVVFALCWLVLTLLRLKTRPPGEKLAWYAAIAIFFVLVYLPSLLVSENYPSNRTLFALDFVVFLLVAETALYFIKQKSWNRSFAVMAGVLLVCNAWYNCRYEFIYPLTKEYNFLKQALLTNYRPLVDTVYVIRPSENSFAKHYGIVASWDEFGVPSMAKKWTPEPLIREIILEATGQKRVAENLGIKSWDSNESFHQSGTKLHTNQVLIDMNAMFK